MKKLLLGFLLVSPVVVSGSFKTFFKSTQVQQVVKKLPLVYNPLYNISILPFGLESRVHPFDGKKYGTVVNYLIDKGLISRNQIVDAVEVTDEQLLRVHTARYLDDLRNNSSAKMAAITEVGLIGSLPNWYTRNRLVKPMRLATGGTVQAMHLALQHGWAINMGAGYHHATAEVANGGFCVFADIPLAAHEAFDAGVERVLIVDLDAHRGNGHEEILAQDNRVFIFDMYNGLAYPGIKSEKEKIDFDYPIYNKIQDVEYLAMLQSNLPVAIEQCKPQLIIYNAGTDIFENDPLGGMGVSKKGIIERDAFVFAQARLHNIPIVMVLSGGYTSESAGIIGESIENLMKSGIVKMADNQGDNN